MHDTSPARSKSARSPMSLGVVVSALVHVALLLIAVRAAKNPTSRSRDARAVEKSATIEIELLDLQAIEEIEEIEEIEVLSQNRSNSTKNTADLLPQVDAARHHQATQRTASRSTEKNASPAKPRATRHVAKEDPDISSKPVPRSDLQLDKSTQRITHLPPKNAGWLRAPAPLLGSKPMKISVLGPTKAPRAQIDDESTLTLAQLGARRTKDGGWHYRDPTGRFEATISPAGELRFHSGPKLLAAGCVGVAACAGIGPRAVGNEQTVRLQRPSTVKTLRSTSEIDKRRSDRDEGEIRRDRVMGRESDAKVAGILELMWGPNMRRETTQAQLQFATLTEEERTRMAVDSRKQALLARLGTVVNDLDSCMKLDEARSAACLTEIVDEIDESELAGAFSTTEQDRGWIERFFARRHDLLRVGLRNLVATCQSNVSCGISLRETLDHLLAQVSTHAK